MLVKHDSISNFRNNYIILKNDVDIILKLENSSLIYFYKN